MLSGSFFVSDTECYAVFWSTKRDSGDGSFLLKTSLPAFVAAFTSRKKLSDEEIDELIRIIDSKRG